MYVHVPPCDRDPPDPVRRADPWMEHPRSQVSSLPAGHPLAGAVSGGRRGHGFLCPRDEYVLRSMLTDPVGIVVWPIEAPGPRLQPRPFCHLVQRHRAHGPVASGPSQPARCLRHGETSVGPRLDFAPPAHGLYLYLVVLEASRFPGHTTERSMADDGYPEERRGSGFCVTLC